MRMKIGAMFIVAVMALAGVSAGYAHWTDSINIQATVVTGDVNWEFTGTSGTWGWKNTVTDALIATTTATLPDNCVLIGSAYGTIIDGHAATLTFSNIFPGVVWCADLVITYTGSVPGKINSITYNNFWPEAGDETLLDYYTVDSYEVYDAGNGLIGTYYDEAIFGVQLHSGYTVHAILCIDLPNDNDYQNLVGGFNVNLEVINYNEYDPGAIHIFP